MDFREFQNRFTAALIDPASAAHFFVGESENRAALAIYRNNVVYSLREVLAEDFPVVKRLLGAALFDHLAADFLKAHLPQHASLTGYGRAFPDFLAARDETAPYPWLADVARIEMARREMFYAAEEPPLSPETLAGLSEAAISARRFSLRASACLLPLAWPADEIWLAHQAGDPPDMEVAPQAITLVLRRAGADIVIERVDAALAIFLHELNAGAELAAATQAAAARTPEFDLTQALYLCLTRRYFKKEHADE